MKEGGGERKRERSKRERALELQRHIEIGVTWSLERKSVV